jgi:hypothetical protein
LPEHKLLSFDLNNVFQMRSPVFPQSRKAAKEEAKKKRRRSEEEAKKKGNES